MHDISCGKGDRLGARHVKKKAQVRLPLSWSLPSQGRQAPISMEDGGRVMWLGLAVSYCLLFRASQLWAYADAEVHPQFCLTRECLTFSRGRVQVEFRNRSTATTVQIRCVASKCDKKEQGARLRVHGCPTRGRWEMGRVLIRAFEVLLELLNCSTCIPSSQRRRR